MTFLDGNGLAHSLRHEVIVGRISQWLFGLFLSTGGIMVLAALDSSVLFSLPFALDAAVVLMVARHRDLFWLYPLLIIPPSLLGAGTTYWLGWKLGDEGLQHFVPKRRLDAIHKRVRRSGAFALAALDLIPPPFPFTPVILVSGALEVAPAKFFVTLAGVRVIRFGGEAVLALLYGGRLLAWLESETVKTVAGLLFILLLVGAAISAYKLVITTRRSRAGRPMRA